MYKKIANVIPGKKLISTGILLLFLMTTAVLAASDITAIKADEDIVYRNILADTVIQSYKDSGICSYSGECYAVVGRIRDLSEGWDSFTLIPVDMDETLGISCSSSTKVHSMVSSDLFMEGSDEQHYFKVMGRFSSSADELAMSVDYIYLSDGTASDTHWSIKDSREEEKVFDTVETFNRSIPDTEAGVVMHYEIPKEWKYVEEELSQNVKGYQYRLNELDGVGNPESLFIFYVDNSHLGNRADKNETEKFNDAIVTNICGSGKVIDYDTVKFIVDFQYWLAKNNNKIVRHTVKTDYADLVYYETTFKDDNNNDFSQHRVEFIFLPRSDTDIGPKVLLYVYPIDGPSETHRAEVLYVLRSLCMQ